MEVRRIPRIILDGDEESASYMAREGIRQLGILKELMSFNDLQQDIRKVEYIDGSRIVCRSCFGEDVVYLYAVKEEEGKLLPKLYVYVTISNYVTIWDLLTGEVATDICNNDGKTYNYYGEPLITFPCHKSELVKWLEGIKNKPTRQVLKDKPEDNRDYLPDNKLDIGNENRVERLNLKDPSYEYYFGVKTPCAWDNLVQDIFEDTCHDMSPRKDCKIRSLTEYDTPKSGYIVNCEPELCSKSFHCETRGNQFTSRYVEGELVYYYRRDDVEYLEPYHSRSKYLYLCPHPSPKYLRDEFSPNPKEIEYTNLECSAYIKPIVMKSSCVTFNCTDVEKTWISPLNLFYRQGRTYSFETELGELIVNYKPARHLPDDYASLYEELREGFNFENNCFALQLIDGVCTYDQHQDWGSGPPDPLCCTILSNSELDRIESESNRFGVSWCGSPFLQEKTEWYRVLLKFYMGGFHSSGRSCRTYCSKSTDLFDCPTAAECEEWNIKPHCKCEAAEIPEELAERFSSVQATIELEHPENYPKERDIPIPEKTNAIRYKRPEDYSGLCAFPDRECGYPEDEKNNICYPFDGTYDIYILGEAIEELINNHYEDGSDDQLLVYLYERPDMIQQSTGK